MALTKESKITQIEVHGDYKHICIETDISGESSDVQAICNTTWTDEVKTAWKDKLIADKGV